MMPTLHQLFRDKLIPWVEDNLEQRLIVARPEMKSSQLPGKVKISRKGIIGRRVRIRNRRHDGFCLYYAEWPEDKLHELTAPKLVCVIKGTTDYTAGKHIITCNEGHFILLPALIPNLSGERSHLEGERRENGYCELLQILVARDYVLCMFCVSERETVTDILELSCIIYNKQAVSLFNSFLEQTSATENYSLKLQQHLLAAFLWVIFHEIELGHEVNTSFKPRQELPPGDSIDELKTYIKINLRYSLTIEKAAKHFYLSPRQFTRHVRRKTGQSFVELLTSCRIEESKRYLSETQWTIKAIALMVGFKSPPHFNAFFRRHQGCSPGTYRKEIAREKD